jgi:hypothetical protein
MFVDSHLFCNFGMRVEEKKYMSSLLEQAIVDAKALKEVAIKNAETSILEKYSDEVRVAVTTLLEAPEDEELSLGDETLGDETPGLELEVPDAHAAGEELCSCPEEDEEITIDFSQLRAEMDAEQEAGELSLPSAASVVDTEGELEIPLAEASAEEEEEEAEEKKKEEDDRDEAARSQGMITDIDQMVMTEDEELDISEESIQQLADMVEEEIQEELKVDMWPVTDGWLGASQAELSHARDMEFAAMRATKTAEELEQEKEAVKDLTEKLTTTTENMSKIKHAASLLYKKSEKQKEIITRIGERLAEVNLTNARLLYANRVLGSNSLNERQKNTIVEAISKAGSVEEAKTIYQTLQSTVMETKQTQRVPNSLSEAVYNRVSPFLPRRPESKPPANKTLIEKMQKLAGIKKKVI